MDGIKITETLEVFVQENGIIRLADTGQLIGRISEDVSFKELDKHSLKARLAKARELNKT